MRYAELCNNGTLLQWVIPGASNEKSVQIEPWSDRSDLKETQSSTSNDSAARPMPNTMKDDARLAEACDINKEFGFANVKAAVNNPRRERLLNISGKLACTLLKTSTDASKHENVLNGKENLKHMQSRIANGMSTRATPNEKNVGPHQAEALNSKDEPMCVCTCGDVKSPSCAKFVIARKDFE